MADEGAAAPGGASRPLAPGPLIRIAGGALAAWVAPAAGGRIAQIVHDGAAWLVGPGEDGAEAAIAWGCYPMVPWAGRIRRGRFRLAGREYRVRPNLGAHAIHGVGFTMPWRVETRSAAAVELALALPTDARWPFGGTARQRIEVDDGRLRLRLSVTAGAMPMPATIGWHPWFRKPERIGFRPVAAYPRDADGIATLPLAAPPPGPWDDCFVNREPVFVHRGGRTLRLASDCRHWVVYDMAAHATCIEPQSGPPDAPNLAPDPLAPGATRSAWCVFEWR